MAILDEFADLASAVVEAFDNGVGGGTGGAALTISRTSSVTATPSTGHLAGTPVLFEITQYVRSRSLMSSQPMGSAGMRKIEEFSVLVTQAALTAGGFTGLPDERCTLIISSAVYPVVRAEREAGEKLVRIHVRRDLGPAT